MAHCEQKTTHPCAVEGCRKPAMRRASLCVGHLKRRQRGKDLSTPLRPYGRSDTEVIRAAAKRYAHAEDDDEYRRAARMLSEYVRTRGVRRRIVQQPTDTPPQG
jgi:hypothetical protein